ncbi:cell surface protein [Methanosarcina vacuolata Z-761]|uniref:Cell surface protein n=1 Tax=Methanosarcina vacuolata Z-761 TaxID=1434123 RepID=A0A0E3Q237_9EURY|nr:cell surface protein [Methanosarcina vacuolata Z-761]
MWADGRNGDYDIYMYNLSTSTETPIVITGSTQFSPAIYENRIVWEDDRNGNQDIYMYDLSTSKETQITTDESDQLRPAIYGHKIVWQDRRNGNWDIYMYDIPTCTETQITSDEGHHAYPAIYEDRVVWEDTRNGNYDIYMYNISTSKETQITTNESWQVSPAIYGDRIVWQDGRNNEGINDDIYMYDLSTSTETQITTNKSGQCRPAIYGDRIVWIDYRNGDIPDIYMATLGSSLPVAAFSASPTSGKAPLNVCFTDKSTGSPTKWKWDFGDGTTSTKQNPTHKYSKVGSYTVKLTATNDKGSNTVTKKDYIKIVTKPVAAFSANPTSGKASLTVAFTDKSTGIPTKWKWSFGDGKTSTQQNPKHQYLQEGKYKITLTVSNAAGSSTVTKTNYIKVTTNTRPGIYSESK